MFVSMKNFTLQVHLEMSCRMLTTLKAELCVHEGSLYSFNFCVLWQFLQLKVKNKTEVKNFIFFNKKINKTIAAM